MARRRIRGVGQWRQPLLLGLAEQLDGHRRAGGGGACAAAVGGSAGRGRAR